ncbi:MAG: FKBP-type peptidyl-prolyl cis-trans isomerase [Bacteroidales bacterium]|nr:FKBP-type peptidyl-prolyl cis-trans isomerase [Bacteroidales bacterium]
MKNKIILLLILCMSAASCVKDKLEETYSRQETQIDTYLTRNRVVKRDSIQIIITPNADDPTKNDTTKVKVEWEDTLDVVYNNGAARLIKTEGTGPELTENGAVSFYYAGYIFSSSPSTLFATNHRETAEGANFELTDADYELIEADMTKARMIDGLRNGLIGVRSGEECEIVFSGKYGFGDEIFGTIPVNSALLYKIWVVGVSNE